MTRACGRGGAFLENRSILNVLAYPVRRARRLFPGCSWTLVMTPAKPVARPLSPHLQIYRLPLAAILSITHRITGVGLAIGVLLLTWWVTAAAVGPAAYDRATSFIGSIVGQLLMVGFSLALFFHLCNG